VPESKIPKGKTLLLDLDETLIHSCSLKENPEHIIKAKSDPDDKIVRRFKISFVMFFLKYFFVSLGLLDWSASTSILHGIPLETISNLGYLHFHCFLTNLRQCDSEILRS